MVRPSRRAAHQTKPARPWPLTAAALVPLAAAFAPAAAAFINLFGLAKDWIFCRLWPPPAPIVEILESGQSHPQPEILHTVQLSRTVQELSKELEKTSPCDNVQFIAAVLQGKYPVNTFVEFTVTN